MTLLHKNKSENTKNPDLHWNEDATISPQCEKSSTCFSLHKFSVVCSAEAVDESKRIRASLNS